MMKKLAKGMTAMFLSLGIVFSGIPEDIAPIETT